MKMIDKIPETLLAPCGMNCLVCYVHLKEKKPCLGCRGQDEGKPEHIAEKIVEGKLRKFFEENSLLMQPYVKDPQKTVAELITEVSSKTGEKIEVARFSRLQVGQGN